MFRFTIRELVLVTLIVSLGLGWWIDHQVQRRLRAESEVKLKEEVGWLESLLQANQRDWRKGIKTIH